jgi:hypothetical protein
VENNGKMTNKKQALLCVLLITPMAALAHGDEVIYTLFIQIISIIISLIILVSVKVSVTGRSILLGIYLFSVIAVFYFINNLSFRDNMLLINLSVAFIPLIVSGLTYLLLRIGEFK